MVQLTVWAAALYVGFASAGAYPPDEVDKLAETSLPKLKEWLTKNPQPGCTYETAVKRREWLVSFHLHIALEREFDTAQERPKRSGTQAVHRCSPLPDVQARLDELSGPRGEESI
jgi:hypothetical protein